MRREPSRCGPWSVTLNLDARYGQISAFLICREMLECSYEEQCLLRIALFFDAETKTAVSSIMSARDIRHYLKLHRTASRDAARDSLAAVTLRQSVRDRLSARSLTQLLRTSWNAPELRWRCCRGGRCDRRAVYSATACDRAPRGDERLTRRLSLSTVNFRSSTASLTAATSSPVRG